MGSRPVSSESGWQPDPALHRALRVYADKQEIANNLALHSRGVDRNDFDLLRSAYHPDAEVSYGMFNGPAADMARFLTDSMAGQPVTLHRTSNIWVKVNGDEARSESYVIAYLRTPADQGFMQRMIGGRYLDRHQHRHGRWAISHRTYVMECNLNQPAAEVAGAVSTDLAGFLPHGGQGAADPGRALLASAAARFQPRSLSEGRGMTHGQAVDVHQLLAKQVLHELLMAYCRGTDRADTDLLASVFHPDATVVTGIFNGPASEFAKFIPGLVRGFKSCFHSVANEWFQIDADGAVGESYVIAFITLSGEDGDRDVITGGRYLDQFEHRNGEWKIAQRTFIADWNINQPSTRQEDGMYAQLPTRGALHPADPIYSFWPS